MSRRLEKRPGVTPAAFSPPIFAGTASVSLFRVSLPPPRGNASGVFIYAFLGQAEQSEMKTYNIGGSRAKRAWVARSGLVTVPPVLFWASWPTSLTSSSLGASHDKILTPKKSQVNLSSERSLKRQNT
jgi:hypothetical protein